MVNTGLFILKVDKLIWIYDFMIYDFVLRTFFIC